MCSYSTARASAISLPSSPPVMPLTLPFGVALLGRQHADHPDEPAEREHLDAVLGIAALRGPDGPAEADEVLGHLHAELLGRHHVPDLVQRDRADDAEEEQHHPQRRRSAGSSLSVLLVLVPWCRRPRSRWRGRGTRRPPRVRRRRPTIPQERVRRRLANTAATTSAIPRKPSRPSQNACTGDLVGGVVEGGADAAVPAGLDRQPEQRERPRRRPARTARTGRRSSRPPARRPATRSGQPERQADRQPHVGRRHLRDASTRRWNSTMEWITDCGCTTTSMSSYGDVEEQVCLDDLETLVDQGRGVGGDHRAHVPGRVGHRLLRA